jgi:hypothetical protein
LTSLVLGLWQRQDVKVTGPCEGGGCYLLSDRQQRRKDLQVIIFKRVPPGPTLPI